MIAIANPSARLEAFCGSAVTTDVKFTVGYFNMLQQTTANQQTQLATTIRTVSNGVTDAQIAPYPGQNAISSSITTGTGAVQVIQYIKAHNTNASSVAVTIQINDGTDDIQWKGTIPAGGTAYCDNEARWHLFAADGSEIVTSTSVLTGTWTPVFTFATPGNLSVTYSTQVGSYTKIGRQVTAWFSIVTSAFTHTSASGNATITGLPFAVQNVTGYFPRGPLQWGGITKANYTAVVCGPVLNTTNMVFQASGSGQASANIAAADMPTAGTVVLVGTISYETDS